MEKLLENTLTNPASRLHSLLKEFINCGVADHNPLRFAIASIFSIESAKSPEIFRCYVQVINLALEVEEKVKHIPRVNLSLYQRPISNIQKHLSTTNIDNSIGTFKNKVTSEDLRGLEFIGDQLGFMESEVEISQDNLQKFEKKIDSLINEVAKGKFDPDFKHFLVSHLMTIRASIQHYRIFGSSGLKGSLAKILGEMILDSRTSTSDETKKSIFRKVVDAMKDINSAISFFRNGEEVVKVLDISNYLKIGQ